MRVEALSTRGEQPGFTLVEFAIALVIFGLLVGGIMQGIELLNNSRIKQSAGEFQAISTAYASYQDRYQALPGDDGPLAAVQARGGEWASVTSAGDSSGELAVELEDAWNAQGEQAAFWQHLRTAGLKLCMSQIPGRAASALDLQLDDGAPRTGDLRANEAVRGEHTNPDNMVFVRWTESGTFTNDFEHLKANGNKVHVAAMGWLRFENGQIVEEWTIVDDWGTQIQIETEYPKEWFVAGWD